MKLVKCPRCDLNYITESEKYCKICLREIKGEPNKSEVELCSVCNEAPALPGRDVCLFCLKEMDGDEAREGQEASDVVDDAADDMDAADTMDEMLPVMDDDMPADAFGDMESLENVRENEDNEDDDEDDADM